MFCKHPLLLTDSAWLNLPGAVEAPIGIVLGVMREFNPLFQIKTHHLRRSLQVYKTLTVTKLLWFTSKPQELNNMIVVRVCILYYRK